MKSKFQRILYGGDYNPNQWKRDIWDEDMKLFKDAHINSATINVFSWAKIQPDEDKYNFTELDAMIEMLSKENYDIVLATSTAALPAWLVKKYPEVSRTDYEGRRHVFGQRHNACPNSPVYRKQSEKLAEKLAERYGSNSHMVCWHVNNEYGGECYCEQCAIAFRRWLKDRYETIEAVNDAWNTEFWGHTLYDWDEIMPPNSLGDGIGTEKTAFAGMSIDYRRFTSDSILDCFKIERNAIRKFDLTTPITTNLMGTYKGLDYFKWAKEMDIVSWDNYPSYNTPWSLTAMTHDLMRGLKKEPFMLMEQTPSQQNWQKYNSLKRPGQMKAQSYQTIAHGANTIQFFQLRRSKGGCEKFHGAVIAHAGTEDTRVFREVAQLGAELEKLTPILNSENEAEVGIIFDWDNFWGLEYASGPSEELKYVEQIHSYYRYFYDENIPVDMIPYDAKFSKYKIIVAPVLYMMKPGMKEALTEYVKQGGILVTTFMSGIVDSTDNVYLGGYPGPLREMTGIWVEEIDALAPEQMNHMVFTDGEEKKCSMLCDIIHLEGAEALAEYVSDFYAGTPVVTKNHYRAGQVYYIGTYPEKSGIKKILDIVVRDADVTSVIENKTELEVIKRSSKAGSYYFIMNFKNKWIPVPEFAIGEVDILSGEKIEKNDKMKCYDVKIILK